MINPILDPILHRKQMREIEERAMLKPKKKKIVYRGNPVVNTTVEKEHYDFLQNLGVELTIKYRKSYTMSEVVRLVIQYAKEFKDELPTFYETCIHNR